MTDVTTVPASDVRAIGLGIESGRGLQIGAQTSESIVVHGHHRRDTGRGCGGHNRRWQAIGSTPVDSK
jgi:hypothetical protein